MTTRALLESFWVYKDAINSNFDAINSNSAINSNIIYCSNTSTYSSNSITTLSNISISAAASASNSSNYAYLAQQAEEQAAGNVTFNSNTAVFASNVASFASNLNIEITFSSNASFFASNAAQFASNLDFAIVYSSNTSAFASNLNMKITFASNTSFFASNAANFSSNHDPSIVFSSNTSSSASNASTFASNSALFSCNLAVYASNNLNTATNNPVAIFASNSVMNVPLEVLTVSCNIISPSARWSLLTNAGSYSNGSNWLFPSWISGVYPNFSNTCAVADNRLDSGGNSYLTGFANVSNGGVVINSSNAYSPFVLKGSSNSASSGFCAKYDLYGNAQWATSISSTIGCNVKAWASYVDLSNNYYMGGYYIGGSVVVQNTDGTSMYWPAFSNAGAQQGAFLVKYDCNGVSKWATTVLSGSNTFNLSIVTDSNLNVFVTGSYCSNAILIDTTGISSVLLPVMGNNLSNNTYVIKYNSNGVTQWAGGVGAVTGGTVVPGGYFNNTGAQRYARCLAMYPNGDVVMNGSYQGSSAVIYGGNFVSSGYSFRATTGASAFCASFSNGNGAALPMYTSLNTASGYALSTCIATDTQGDVFVSGEYQTSPNGLTIYNALGVSSGTTMTSNNGTPNAYIVKYNNSGIVKAAVQIGGTSVYGMGGCAVDFYNNIYCSGYSPGNTGVFINNYTSNGTLIGQMLPLYGNPTGYVTKFDSNLNFLSAGRIASIVTGVPLQATTMCLDCNGTVFVGQSFIAWNPGTIIYVANAAGTTYQVASPVAAVASSGTMIASVMKLVPVPGTYTLASSLPSSSNGLVKQITNLSQDMSASVNIISSNAANVYHSVTIGPGMTRNAVLYGATWYMH